MAALKRKTIVQSQHWLIFGSTQRKTLIEYEQMAHNSTITHAGSSGLGERLTQFFADVRTRVERRKTYRSTLYELRKLGDRELADLGLNRSVLKRIAYQAAYEQ